MYYQLSVDKRIKLPVVLIDNGHGSDTAGKRSPDAMKNLWHSPYYFREYDWTRQCARGIVDVLQSLGETAFLLVKEDWDVSLKERVERVNAYCRKYGKNNVLLVSVHNNAAGDGSRWLTARGWAAYTTVGVTKSDYLASYLYDAAEATFKAPLKVRKYTQEKKVGRDFEEPLYVLKNTYCPAVLTENFFQDNKDDVAYLKSDKGLGACIDVHVQGITDYMKIYCR
ncbi:MAG: N-acetylmuramoyl-L-alanine amidase [Prevotella sp.]|nr:N-acetylmuramoyl-L-alanine amidase [Prevotella sp.]